MARKKPRQHERHNGPPRPMELLKVMEYRVDVAMEAEAMGGSLYDGLDMGLPAAALLMDAGITPKEAAAAILSVRRIP